MFVGTFSLNCQKAEGVSVNLQSGIEGRVYSIGAPAVTRDWSPPPLERISTIIVLNNRQTEIKEVATDAHGRFSISLPSGIYYLRVKESLLPATTGPFNVTEDHLVSVEAYYDNGIR